MSVRATVSSASKCIFANRLSVGPVRTAVRLFSSSNSEAGQHGAPNTPTARASTQGHSKPYLPTPFPNDLRTVKKRRSPRSKLQDGGNGARTSVSRPSKPSKVRAKKEGCRSGSPSKRPSSSRDKIKSHSKKRDEGAVARSVDSDKGPKSVPVKGVEKARVVCAFEIPFATETLFGAICYSKTIFLSDILRVTASFPTAPGGYVGTRVGPRFIQVCPSHLLT